MPHRITLEALYARIERLRQRATTLLQNQRTLTIINIVKLMHSHEIPLDELLMAYEFGRPRVDGRQEADGRAAVAPKYRHPQTSATWSGRGRAPKWLTDAEAAGMDRTHFAVRR